MSVRPVLYLYDHPGWTDFSWDTAAISKPLEQVNFQRGVLSGQLQLLGLDVRQQALLDALTDDAARSSRIEGEPLDEAEVKSSVARRLGLSYGGLPELNQRDIGVVDVTLDATTHATGPLTEDRLFRWHRALFPNGQSGVHRILTGQYRTDADGPMQVVGARLDQRTVHFEAPAATRVPGLMADFLSWLGAAQPLDPVIKAGLAHLYFLTIHPFEDGNGRIGRALTDLLLARADRRSERHYSLSRQIQQHQKAYYEVLERTQRQTTPDLTFWLTWFLERVLDATLRTQETLGTVRTKRLYFEQHGRAVLNARQHKVLNRLFEDFEGNLTRKKYVTLIGQQPVPGRLQRQPISEDTALRDLDDLVSQGLLVRQGAGRGVHYLVPLPKGAELFGSEVFTASSGSVPTTGEPMNTPLPSQEPQLTWQEARDLLGDDELVTLTGVNEVDLPAVDQDERATLDAPLLRLHALMILTELLSGTFDRDGVRRWFSRPRTQLDGLTPREVLGDAWSPDGPDYQRIRALAQSDLNFQAT